ncbi:helicase-2b [Penaeus vannamei nudivirus]|nr:helicase 2 [Penaeus vannamei nucleopolyhedrovirus]
MRRSFKLFLLFSSLSILGRLDFLYCSNATTLVTAILLKSNMNPIIQKLTLDKFSAEDYQDIATYLACDVLYLKKLDMNTIKEKIYYKIVPSKKSNCELTIKTISVMSELDCEEYLKMYNINVDFESSRVLDGSAKSKLVLSQLNEGQLNVVKFMCTSLSCSFDINGKLVNPQVFLLDAPGGTGKSFLIDCLALCTRNVKICIIAKNNTLLSNIITLKNYVYRVSTICKFFMQYFDLSYDAMINFFTKCDTIEDYIEKLKYLVAKRAPFDFDLLIVDEYSLESPLLLLSIVILSKLEKVNVLFMGDIRQQNTLSTTKLHTKNNYDLLSNISNVKQYAMNQQMRIQDAKLLNIIDYLRTYISDNSQDGNVRNSFHIKWNIFKQFKSKFLLHGDILKDVYLTDFHANIKVKQYNMIEKAKSGKIKYKEAQFMLIGKNEGDTQLKPLVLPDNSKFLPYIPLIEGSIYLHNKKFVKLLKINDDVLICKMPSGENVNIRRTFWDERTHECSNLQFEWMCENFDKSEHRLVQFPLRPVLFTYHFIQGLTLSKQTLSLDIDSQYVNSLYVGFSRITNADQISSLKTKDIISLSYTLYKNDEYYYKFNNPSTFLVSNMIAFIKNPTFTFDDSSLQCAEVDKSTFERCNNKRPIKTKRRFYNTLKRKSTNSEVSSLTNLAKLIESEEYIVDDTTARKYYERYG